MTSPARDRDFRLVWAGTAASRLGTSVASVATPLVALTELDAGPLVVTSLTAATWLPWLLVGLPAGAWVDRLAKRPVMVVCDVVSALAVLSVPLAVWAGVLTVAHLLLAALGLGTAAVLFTTAWTSYLPAVLEPDELVPANALLHGSESAAQVAGPGLAGALAGALGAAAGLVVQAAAFGASALCLLLVRRPERRPAAAGERDLRREVAEGVRFVARDPLLRRLVLHGAVSNFALTGYSALLVVLLVRDVGLAEGTVGLVLTLSALGGVAGAAAAQPLVRRLGSARTLVRCKAGAGPWALLVPLTTGPSTLWLLVLGSTAVVAGVVAGNVVSGSFRQRYVPAGLLGRVTTSMQFVNLGTIPLGALTAGVLATALGTRTAVWLLVVAYALSGLLLVLGPLRGRRDLPEAALVRPGPGQRAAQVSPPDSTVTRLSSASPSSRPDRPPATSSTPRLPVETSTAGSAARTSASVDPRPTPSGVRRSRPSPPCSVQPTNVPSSTSTEKPSTA